MGWVVYDTRTLLMEKYYKKAATARRIVTQHNTPRDYGFYQYTPDRMWACCSYRDFEGILMGLKGDALKMWQFCNKEYLTGE